MRVPRRLKDLQGQINTVVPELSAQLHRSPRPSEIAARLQTRTADIVEALQAAHAYRPNSLDTPIHGDSGEASLADIHGQPDPSFELFTATHSLAPHLAALPARERSIVIMRFYHDMTQTQIAEKIGISQMHVSRLLAATLTQLREAVDADTTPPRPPPLPAAPMSPETAGRTAPPPGIGSAGATGRVTPTTMTAPGYPAEQVEVCFTCMRPRRFCACAPEVAHPVSRPTMIGGPRAVASPPETLDGHLSGFGDWLRTQQLSRKQQRPVQQAVSRHLSWCDTELPAHTTPSTAAWCYLQKLHRDGSGADSLGVAWAALELYLDYLER